MIKKIRCLLMHRIILDFVKYHKSTMLHAKCSDCDRDILNWEIREGVLDD